MAPSVRLRKREDVGDWRAAGKEEPLNDLTLTLARLGRSRPPAAAWWSKKSVSRGQCRSSGYSQRYPPTGHIGSAVSPHVLDVYKTATEVILAGNEKKVILLISALGPTRTNASVFLLPSRVSNLRRMPR